MMRKFFHNDTVIRVVSILISVLLWMYVVGINNPNVSVIIRSVPVSTTGTPNADKTGLEIISQDVKTVDVKVEGRHSDVSKIIAEDIIAQVDVSDIDRTGSYELDIYLDTDAKGVILTNNSANKVKIFADKIKKEYKDIVVKTKGEPKEGYVISNIVPEIEKLMVSGPKSHIDDIYQIDVWVDVSDADGTISEICGFTPVDKNGKKVDVTFINTNGIKSTGVTVSFQHEKEVEIIPAFESSEISAIYDVAVTPDKVKIVGDADKLKDVSKIQTKAIKLSDEQLSHKSITVEEKLDLPQDVICEGEIQSISVKLTAK